MLILPLFSIPSQPLNPIITPVRLSKARYSTQPSIVVSKANPTLSCTEHSSILYKGPKAAFKTSLLVSFSNIPSQPKRIKSCSLVTLKHLISGSQIVTSGLPPYLLSFDSMSPMVRETDNLPGSTRAGPFSAYYFPGIVGSGM
jgi:hypothetical protein